jgi:hypothetical protein
VVKIIGDGGVAGTSGSTFTVTNKTA